MRQRFSFSAHYGQLVVEAVLEEIWPEDFREWVVTEVRFRETSGDGEGGEPNLTTWTNLVEREQRWI